MPADPGTSPSGGPGVNPGPPGPSAASGGAASGGEGRTARLLDRQADALEQLVYVLDPSKRPQKRGVARLIGLMVVGSSTVLGGYEFVAWVLDQWQRRAMISNWVEVAREMQDVENAPEIALDLLAKADEIDPQSAGVVKLRAYVRGMQAVKRLLQLDRPFNAEDVAMAGAAHAEASLLEQLDPGSPDWALLRGQLAMAQKEPVRARAYFERALALDPENVLVRVRLADMLYETAVAELESKPASAKEDFEAANRMLDAALKRDPRSKLAWLYKGNHALTERPADAIDAFDRAIAIDPRFELAHRNRGLALISLDRLAEAEEAFRRALEIEPDSSGALASLSQLYGRQDEYESALLYARRATEANPGSLDAWTWLAAVEADFGSKTRADGDPSEGQALLDAAVESYGRAIELDPRSADVRCERSQLQRKLGRLAQAGADARQAVLLAPSNAYAWNALAESQIAIGEVGAAKRSLAEVIRLAPTFDVAYKQLAMLQVEAGELEEAESSISKAIDCSEADHLAGFLAKRAEIRERRGDREAALVDAVAARKAEPESFDHWILEARLLLAVGRPEAACAALVEANQRKPGAEEVLRLRDEAKCAGM